MRSAASRHSLRHSLRLLTCFGSLCCLLYVPRSAAPGHLPLTTDTRNDRCLTSPLPYPCPLRPPLAARSSLLTPCPPTQVRAGTPVAALTCSARSPLASPRCASQPAPSFLPFLPSSMFMNSHLPLCSLSPFDPQRGEGSFLPPLNSCHAPSLAVVSRQGKMLVVHSFPLPRPDRDLLRPATHYYTLCSAPSASHLDIRAGRHVFAYVALLATATAAGQCTTGSQARASLSRWALIGAIVGSIGTGLELVHEMRLTHQFSHRHPGFQSGLRGSEIKNRYITVTGHFSLSSTGAVNRRPSQRGRAGRARTSH